MKGFVDKLDKLTLMGNQLIDENMGKSKKTEVVNLV